MKGLALVRLLAVAFFCTHGGAAQPVNLAGPWKLHLDGSDQRRALPGIDDSAWPVLTLPQRTPRPEQSYWLRRTVAGPASAGPLEITIGLVSESYEVYANGARIGGTGDFGANDVRFFQPHSFRLPQDSSRPGAPLTIALRIWNRRALWGNQAHGVADEGPYWLTSSAHAESEVRLAQRGILLTLVLPLVVMFGIAVIGICLVVLWLPERGPREVAFFAAHLLLYAVAMAIGTWMVAKGGSSFWWRVYKQNVLLAHAVLPFAVTAALRLPSISRWTVAGVFAASMALQWQWVNAYHLFPWILLTLLQCIRGISVSPRANLQFAVPAVALVAVTLNNIAPPQWRILPRIVEISGLTLSFTNLIQIAFAVAILILLLQRLGKDRKDKQRLAAELEAARCVQQLLISGIEAPLAGYALDARYLPAQEVGGDLYYVLPVASGNGFTRVTGDVSGKGLRAALLVSMIVGALRQTRERGPVALLRDLNSVMVGQAGGGFVTCCCARFDADGTVTIANAGHPSPYFDGRGLEVEAGLPLGVVAGVKYAESVVRGERFTFVSDGVVEAANAKGLLFGFERTRESSGKSAQQIAEAAKAWGQNDDITVVTVRRAG